MKLKYQTLSKEEKIKVKEEFYASELGKENKFRLIRIIFIGVLSLIYSAYCIYEYTNTDHIFYLINAVTFIIAGIVLIIGYFKVKLKLYNKIAIKK